VGLLKLQTWRAPGEGEGRENFSTKFSQKVRGKTGPLGTQKLRDPAKFYLQTYLLGMFPFWPAGVRFPSSPEGRGAAPANLTKIFNVFRLTVCRSTAGKPNDIEITFMPHFLGLGTLQITCITDHGYFARYPGNSPPNMTPISDKIGTIAGARISPKRLVILGNNLRHVVAGSKIYKEKNWSLGTNRGY